MTILYLLAITLLILIIRLIIRRKWKTLMWTIGSLIVVSVAGWFLFLLVVSKAFRPACDNNRTWKIGEYEIIEKKCLGFAGPTYYPVYLFKDQKKIDELTFIPDSTCVVTFIPEPGDTLTFDICEEELK